jgi:hypothetical protein
MNEPASKNGEGNGEKNILFLPLDLGLFVGCLSQSFKKTRGYASCYRTATATSLATQLPTP